MHGFAPFDKTVAYADDLRRRCRAHPRRLALPESDDPRVLEAGLQLVAENAVSSLYLFHDRNSCGVLARNFAGNYNLDDQRIVYYDLRFHPEVRLAVDRVLRGREISPLFVAMHLLANGQLDAICSGATCTTAEVIRSALAFLPLAETKTVTSSFLLSKGKRNLLFADCAVLIEPDVEQLVAIACATVDTHRLLFPNEKPKVAFLSFSTKGSASHPAQKKIARVAEIFRQKFPQIDSDGELQFDAAIDPAIALQKNPAELRLRGDANCFIFPNLDAANISYKICQRLGNFTACGPILQGFSKRLCDLSRGANALEIKLAAYVSLC